MGYVMGENVKPVGDHLLRLLKEKGSIRYGEEFFDGTDEQRDRLRAAIGFGKDVDDEHEQDHLPVYADCAVSQLEDAGLVETERELPEVLIDGNHDYTITLTGKGRTFTASGEEFRYRDMDL